LQPSKVRELSPSLGHRCERPPGLIIGCRLGSEIGGFGSSEINISCFHLVVHLTGVLFLFLKTTAQIVPGSGQPPPFRRASRRASFAFSSALICSARALWLLSCWAGRGRAEATRAGARSAHLKGGPVVALWLSARLMTTTVPDRRELQGYKPDRASMFPASQKAKR
jgi:hypothetical protein